MDPKQVLPYGIVLVIIGFACIGLSMFPALGFYFPMNFILLGVGVIFLVPGAGLTLMGVFAHWEQRPSESLLREYSSRRCPKCGTMNDAYSKFCLHCGTQIQPDTFKPPTRPSRRRVLRPPPEPFPKIEGGKTCDNCNTSNPPEARFCIKCGTYFD
ncbi:MAG: zinc-ribbon domain-containing protein [Promethearchaeota archaeon]